jgi:hypothetical protein
VKSALLVKSVHGVSIKACPCPAAVMERQVQKGQDGFVDFFRIYLHELRTVPWYFQILRILHILR